MRRAFFGLMLIALIIFVSFGLIHKPGPESFLNFYLTNLKKLNAEKAYACIEYENGMAEPFEHFKEGITGSPLIDYTIHHMIKNDDGSYKASVMMAFGRDDGGPPNRAEVDFKVFKEDSEWKLLFPEYKVRQPTRESMS